jgi:hypothetical protein
MRELSPGNHARSPDRLCRLRGGRRSSEPDGRPGGWVLRWRVGCGVKVVLLVENDDRHPWLHHAPALAVTVEQARRSRSAFTMTYRAPS